MQKSFAQPPVPNKFPHIKLHHPNSRHLASLPCVLFAMAAAADASPFDQQPSAKKFGLRLRSLCALHPELTGHAMDYTELKGLLCALPPFASTEIPFSFCAQVLRGGKRGHQAARRLR
jgi:hypothetical protein